MFKAHEHCYFRARGVPKFIVKPEDTYAFWNEEVIGICEASAAFLVEPSERSSSKLEGKCNVVYYH